MQSSDLANQECVPCKGGTPPLKGSELRKYEQDLGADWSVMGEHHLEKEFRFPDFKQALEFTNRIGELAEQQGHHPDIHLSYGSVKVTLHTHKINGLAESDFVMAAKIQRLHDEP